MVLMETPAIVVGAMLIRIFDKKNQSNTSISSLVKHSVTNESVLLILGSLVIGMLANDEQPLSIKTFTTNLLKGFLAIFLLDVGIVSGRKINDFIKSGWFVVLFAIAIPLVNGCIYKSIYQT